jgi:sulfur carrier protein
MDSNTIHHQINIQVNGEEVNCQPEINLADLLIARGLNPRLVAVEYNGEIIHRQYWQDTKIKQGDRLEIVTIVGGG